MNWQKVLFRMLPHGGVVVLFVVISLVYMSPVMQGKNLRQHDVIQSLGASYQSQKYYKETGDFPFWNPYMFSGMPNYMIYMDYPSSISVHIGRFFVNLLPEPANILFLYMLGAYVGLSLMGFSYGLSFLGALGFAFSSYNIINIEAGHISKCLSVAFILPIIGAVWQVYRGKYFVGGVLLMFFSAIHQYANFVQMTYYLGLTLVIFAFVEFIMAVKQKRLKDFIIASLVALFAGLISISNHINRYMVISEYVKESTRGESELSDSPENVVLGVTKPRNTKKRSSGLDREYAFRWSYGIGETLNLLIPNAYGGSSFVLPDEQSKIFEIIEEEAPKYNLKPEMLLNYLLSEGALPALYWGEQPGTAGPAYMGVVVLILFAWAMVVSRNYMKWWLLGAVLLCISIAWGKNFFLNDLFFDYLPLFNKFRAVTMILSLMPIFLVIGVAMGLQETLEILQKDPNTIAKKLKFFAILVLCGLLLLALVGGMFLDFRSSQDRLLVKESGEMADFFKKLVRAVQSERANLYKNDAWRSWFFGVFVVGILWLWWKSLLKWQWVMVGLSVIGLADLWGVAKRFLNNEKFVDKEEARTLEPTPADETILKDTTYYRVLNLNNPFNDATTSYFHHSAGGYHGAKLRIYQDLISGHIEREIRTLYQYLQNNLGNIPPDSVFTPVINMLNVKYFIVPLQSNKNIAITNPNVLGAAWIVPEYKLVESADEELKALKTFDPKQVAIIRTGQSGLERLKELRWDKNASVRLVKRTPNQLTYYFEAQMSQLIVFSEIYYKEKSGWQIYIDGIPADLWRVNYALQGTIVPAGKHTITLRFMPTVYYKGEQLALISSILMLSLLVGVLLLKIRKLMPTGKIEKN